MNRVTTYAIATSAFVILLGTLAFSFPSDAYAAPPEPRPVDVNVVNTDRTQLEFVVQQGFGDGLVTVFTVPAGSVFVLTDAVFTPALLTDVNVHGANVSRDSSDLLRVGLVLRAIVDPAQDRNVAFHFQTGFEFLAGEDLIYNVGGATLGDIHAVLVGYLVEE